MSGKHSAFVGSIPENYDRYLGPMFFEPYAQDIAERIQVGEGASVLEIACGTGIVTRHLRNRLPKSAKLVATDLNEAMITYAARKFEPDNMLEWKQADATLLPFADASFDAIVCQFGLMFFPDKETALSEAYRVLRPTGVLLLSVWDSLENNELGKIAHETVASFFEHDPPAFYNVPFGFHDQQQIKKVVCDAGFKDFELTAVVKPGISPSAADAAKGLVEGSPILVEISQRGMTDVQAIEAALAAAIASKCGDQPVRSKLHALVCTGRR